MMCFFIHISRIHARDAEKGNVTVGGCTLIAKYNMPSSKNFFLLIHKKIECTAYITNKYFPVKST